jgi:hypothetical protein
MGIERFAFTGGEPLIHKDIVRILLYALSLKPCLVLTNGTAPLIRRPHHLAQLRASTHALSFRVSIDYPNEAQHDAGRGLGNYRKALQGMRRLVDAGFLVSIARQIETSEDAKAVNARFRQLLRKQLLPEDLPVIAIPELGPPLGAMNSPYTPNPTLLAMTACSRSRMLLQREGALVYSPCPLVNDSPRFDLATDLATACARPIVADHARCAVCLTQGVNYIGVDA